MSLCFAQATEGAAIPKAADVQAYEVQPASAPEAKLVSGSGLTSSTPFLASVHIVRELHSGQSDRSCIHVELDVRGSSITYEAGDHIGVLPENGPEVVARAAQLLGRPLDYAFSLAKPFGESDLPNPFAGKPNATNTADASQAIVATLCGDGYDGRKSRHCSASNICG
jgi:sulfite reductase alpha subunit-like flavoprotein